MTSSKQTSAFAENTRSDTIDILNYNINLNITDFTGKIIKGYCIITLTPKLNNINTIYLDLLALTIDSVEINDLNLSYIHVNELVTINLVSPINIGDTLDLKVSYRGIPQKDASGWGGFYFSAPYAFNLGVGFAANPHTYGRVWFPCFDNFVERSAYEFFITTDSSKKATCNGMLIDSTNNADATVTWHWKLNQTIPTYLACVAVGPYQTISWSHNGLNNIITIELYASAGDTTNMKSSFTNLNSCIDAFEKNYGPHGFDKIGFSLVPFNSGAMEHATNIAYPSYAADGSLSYETLFAHELSHHWWGDLTTCETAADMWLNEGWASYSEYLFLEYVYGKQKYKQGIRENHENVVHYAHIDDNGYRAIFGIPQEYTYGSHVYNKGADVAHTLRTYMGDSLFFSCITGFLAANSFKSMNSFMFRDYLSSCSGVDLASFFNNWVFNPGFPHFSIDSVASTPLGTEYHDVSVYIRQRLKSAPDYYIDAPIQVTFMDTLWNKTTSKVWIKGQCGILNTSLNFNPTFIALDMEEEISDAIVDEYRIISTTGIHDYSLENVSFNISTITDSVLLRAEHHFVPPDRFKTPIAGLFLSDYHFWKIDGIFSTGFLSNATFKYNGKNSTSGGYLDNTFITNNEDSLVMLYRSSPSNEWTIVDSFSINKKGSGLDKSGEITVYNIKRGEYTLGLYDYDKTDTTTVLLPDNCVLLGMKKGNSILIENKSVKIYPNPALNILTIETVAKYSNIEIEKINIYNNFGEIVLRKFINTTKNKFEISIKDLMNGIYFVEVISKQQKFSPQKLAVIR